MANPQILVPVKLVLLSSTCQPDEASSSSSPVPKSIDWMKEKFVSVVKCLVSSNGQLVPQPQISHPDRWGHIEHVLTISWTIQELVVGKSQTDNSRGTRRGRNLSQNYYPNALIPSDRSLLLLMSPRTVMSIILYPDVGEERTDDLVLHSVWWSVHQEGYSEYYCHNRRWHTNWDHLHFPKLHPTMTVVGQECVATDRVLSIGRTAGSRVAEWILQWSMECGPLLQCNWRMKWMVVDQEMCTARHYVNQAGRNQFRIIIYLSPSSGQQHWKHHQGMD